MKKKLIYIAGGIATVVALITLALPSILQGAGLHPEYIGPVHEAPGKRALIITTSHGVLAPVGETEGQPQVFGHQR